MPTKQLSDVGGEPQDYWSTMGGIGVRLEMFGHQLEWGTFNDSVRITASAVGIFDMKIIGAIIATSCAWCRENLGKVYRSNRGFLPKLPHHPNCGHWWDIAYVGEK